MLTQIEFGTPGSRAGAIPPTARRTLAKVIFPP
jgi:hypothetical protein